MADTPNLTSGSSAIPYLATGVVLFLLGIIFIGMVLYMRPGLDPLLIITPVMGFAISIGAALAAFIKAQETHLTVNSQLTAWKKEFYAMSHAEGMLKGQKDEQARVAEQTRVAAVTSSVQPASVLLSPSHATTENTDAVP